MRTQPLPRQAYACAPAGETHDRASVRPRGRQVWMFWCPSAACLGRYEGCDSFIYLVLSLVASPAKEMCSHPACVEPSLMIVA